jgi:ATP-dependent DNA helicase RecG
MTATPIPRTLALTLYGDLDNTVLDEMPPGRQPIETHWFTPAERERAYRFVQHQIDRAGRRSSSAHWWKNRRRSKRRPP